MIQDDDYEVLVTTPERIESLGFKPQKEILTNHVLPYADDLDEESNRFLEQVKTNLAKAVMLREMKPACGVWSSRLIKYVSIYGLKFSKEDHIALIKLAYELVLIPDLEPCKVHKFATLFVMLTKKRYLLSPDDLTLPWRPLYEVGKKIFEKSSTSIGMYHYLSSLDKSYISMVKCAKPYFEVTATKEILVEFLPQLSPWSADTPMDLFTSFLPLGLDAGHADQGHKLWFDKLMDLWDSCYNSQCGIGDLMTVFAGLSKKNPGAIDWSPHVPKMFTRFLHSLNLPVSYKDMQYSKSHSLDIKHIATWIVWNINPDGLILKHLRSFLAGIESYLHSANAGRWSFKLRDLLRKLAREFLSRVRRERENRFKESWENQTPEEYKLRDEDITDFVNIVLGPTLQAVYSRSGSLDISVALQNLATLRPSIVVPPLIEKLRTSLTSLTEPHRVTAAMSAVAAVARPMLRGADAGYPEGPTHVVPLLMAVLPGLDPNDLKKTLVSLHFISIFSWMVPYIDCSSAHQHYSDLTEEELLVCESTAQMEDFVLIFLDRLFTLIESSVMENARIDTKEPDGVRSRTDAVVETALSSATTSVLMQCSPKIFNEALRKFKTFALGTTFETNVSGSIVGVILRVFARINSEATLPAFLPELCEELKDLLSSDEVIKEENPPRDLVYRLVLLMNVVQCDGRVLLNYIPQVISVLDRALKLYSTYAITRASEILSHIFVALTAVDLKEWRSSPKDYSTAPEKWLPIREWGHGCLLQDVALQWHIPNAEEAESAQMLVDRYLKPEMARFRQWLSGERDMCRKRRLRSLYIINAILSCSTFLPIPDEEPLSLMESEVPPTSIPFTTGVKQSVTLDGANLRVAITNFLVEVQTRLLADKTDDTRSLEMLIQVWERVVIIKGHRSSSAGLEARMRSYGALERAVDGRGGAPGGAGGGVSGAARLRMLTADAARLQHETRLDLVCEAGITPSAMKALHALYELSINTYTSVRVHAQMRLSCMLSRYPYSYRALVPKLAELLTTGGEGDEWHVKHKGALFIMLGPRSAPIIAKQDWEVVRTLWPAILKAPVSEKPIILKLEQVYQDSVLCQFPMVNTRLEFSHSVVNTAAVLLPKEQLNSIDFQQKLAKAKEIEAEGSNTREQLYKDLVEELVEIAETPNIQWRRLELVMHMLSVCPSIQTQYPASAVQLMVRSLIHDDIAVRRTAQRLTQLALKQRKRKLKKISVDPYDVAGVKRSDNPVPGYRKDLEWAMYAGAKVPETDEEWDKPFLRNPNLGFYAWPDKIEVAAPSNEQVFSSHVSPEEMEAGERHIYEFFTQDSNVDRLVAFLTVEEKKGKDKFNGTRYSVFRMLFSQFGEKVADKFLAHAHRCAGDSQEAPQRFAAEVISGALQAPRYWSRARALPFYEKTLRVLQKGLSSVTPETLEDWGTCVASGTAKLDPRRGAGVFGALLDMCSPPPTDHDSDADYDTSFAVCARLYALQGSVSSQTWRTSALAGELLRRLEAAHFIQHPYQNVRDGVGSILMTLFDSEVELGDSNTCELIRKAPHLSDFLASVRPRLAPLYDENGDIVIKTAACMPSSAAQCDTAGSLHERAPASPEPVLHAPHAPPVHVAAAALAMHHDPNNSGEDGGAAAGNSADDGGPVSSALLDKQLSARLDTALRLAGDAAPPAPRDHARAVNLLTTVLRGCMGVLVHGVCVSTERHYEMAGIACAVAARGPAQQHDELARAADSFLASLALANHTPSAFDKALETLERLADERSWWARLAALDFAQPLLFYGLPLLCARADRAVRAEAFALKLMIDPRLEVRQAAAKLLTGLMHCRALPDEGATLRRLLRSCRREALLERHSGVLGLCAYLASRPYTLPKRLGEVLGELSRHTSAPDPIPATIRKALADFRRTHHDDWPNHRELLTQEELDLLSDLTSPPSYCA